MKIFLLILAIIFLLSGLGLLVSAQSSIHEIGAFVLLLISAVFLSSAGIIDSVNQFQNDVKSYFKNKNKE